MNESTQSESKFIIGLGNKGDRYQGTRHNIGFWSLEQMSNWLNGPGSEHVLSQGAASLQSRHKAIIQSYKLNTKSGNLYKLQFIYPQTYMNESGQTVRSLMQWYKLPSMQNILIIYDDISLPAGQIRWSTSGGAGGHHGIESIYQQTGKRDCIRLRIGIGPDPGGDRRANYVLKTIPPADRDLIEGRLTDIRDSIWQWINNQSIGSIMNVYNRTL